VLKLVDFNLIGNVLHITLQKYSMRLNWWPRRPSDWSNSADLSPSHLSVQAIPDMVAEMWRRMRVSRAWKNTFRVLLFDDINRIRVWQLLSEL
jgi:hypothetical protein